MRMHLLKTTELIRRILLDLCLKSVVQYIAQLLHMKNMSQNAKQNVTDYGSILVTHIVSRIMNGSAINPLDVMPWQPMTKL
jgi:predicted metalloenzyme YecM